MSQPTDIQRSPKHRWLIVLLLGPAVVIGLIFWNKYRSTRDALSQLPAVDVSNREASIADVITEGVTRVREEPLAGAAWGHYGTVLLANDFVAESATCFLWAGRLEPENARWAYLQGVSLARIEPVKAIPVSSSCSMK